MSSFYCSPNVAYISLSPNQNSNDANLKLVRDYCLTLSYEVDIFAEEVDPSQSSRPLFEEVLQKIGNGEVSILIIPSLNHVLGFEEKSKKDFLDFLAKHHVKIITLSQDRGPVLTILGGGI